MDLPKEFINYVFHGRVKALRRLLEGGIGDDSWFLIEITRATPVVITYGPAGLSGSVKMVGFIPRNEYLKEFTEKAVRYAYVERPKGMCEVIKLLLNEFYVLDKLDLNLLGGLEMGFKHSWVNIRATKKATLLYYTPPNTSFEVRCDVKIIEEGMIKDYLNAMHDLFHKPSEGKRSNYPAYIFKIKEMYNNSNSPMGFGRKIYG
ncbi:MAG: hypothetical protein B6U85_09515 [Desulfurococcales archaeon ex4484_42]|nr:MAG: hypothetical protein B6U85_09515 [Desulfurococcales archaeon ex4484_42]